MLGTAAENPEVARKVHFLTLDALRGVAAFVVVIFHRRWWLDLDRSWHGFLAVDFFFVLSGFVIAHAYGEKLSSGAMSLLSFLRVRAIRLYPLIVFGACLGVLAFLIEAVQTTWFGLGVRALAALPLAMMALPTPFLEQPFFPNAPVWSLFWEILANVAVALLAPMMSTRRLIYVIVASAIAVVATVVIYQEYGDVGFRWHNFYLGTVRVTYPFASGILLYRLWQAGHLDRIPRLPAWFIALILLAVLVVPLSYNRMLESAFVTGSVLIVLPAIVAFAAVTHLSGRWMPVGRLSGELSYPIYILHMPIFNLLDRAAFYVALTVPARLGLAVTVILVTSYFVSRIYDVPVRRFLTGYAARKWAANR